MEISIDGERREVALLPATIGTLIDELKTSVGQDDRVVLSVSVDGKEMDICRQQEIADTPAGQFGSVEIETADAKVLCRATLEEAGRHIQPVVDEASRVAELLDAGKDTEAFSRILPCLEVWSTIMAAVEKVAILLELDIREVTTGEASLPEVIQELAEMLRDLKEGIDARDLVAVSDAMKHEMPEVAGKLSEQLAALCSTIAAT